MTWQRARVPSNFLLPYMGAMKANVQYNIGKAGTGFNVLAAFEIPKEMIEATLAQGTRYGMQRVNEIDDVLGIYKKNAAGKRERQLNADGSKMTRSDIAYSQELAEKLAKVLGTIKVGEGKEAPTLTGEVTVGEYEGESPGPAWKQNVKVLLGMVKILGKGPVLTGIAAKLGEAQIDMEEAMTAFPALAKLAEE